MWRLSAPTMRYIKPGSSKMSWRAPLSTDHRCWKCKTILQPERIFCKEDACGVVQSIVPSDLNYFDLLGVDKGSVTISDMKTLELNFKALQKRLHPDKFTLKSAPEQAASAVTSSTVNQAYQTLRNPQMRLAYILSCHGINVLGEEGGTFGSPELMSDIFELRSKIEEAESVEVVKTILKDVEVSIDENNSLLTILLKGCDDIDRIKSTAVRLQYMYKVMEEIKHKIELLLTDTS